MNTLNFATVGAYLENSIDSLTSSTPVLLAASISNTSMWFELIMDSQLVQKLSLHKLSTPLSQFSAFATILANVVFPIPLIPVKRKAFEDFLFFKELKIVLVISSCPIRSLKV